MKALTLSGVVFLTVIATSCGNEASPVRVGAEPQVEAAGISLPGQIIGLQLREENVDEKLEEVDRAYLDSVGLFSLRENDLLRATLQVGRLNALAEPNSASFRNQIIDLLGSTRPTPIQVNGQIVYLTTGNEQSIFAWFEGRGFFVLNVHREYPFPRTLLRQILSLKQDL